jgi:hypothetical protein
MEIIDRQTAKARGEYRQAAGAINAPLVDVMYRRAGLVDEPSILFGNPIIGSHHIRAD